MGCTDFEIMPADLDELAVTAPSQQQRAEKLARLKVAAISEELKKRDMGQSEVAILGADTYVITDQDEVLEKPASKEKARQMLAAQSGSTVRVLTGAAYEVWRFKEDASPELTQQKGTIEVAECTFRDLTQQEITHFVENEPVTTWSAAFCPAYPTSAAFVDTFSGSLTSFTHGFPVGFFAQVVGLQ